MTTFFSSGFMQPEALVKAFNLALAFLHASPTWSLKFSLKSILTPDGFAKVLICICAVPIFARIF